MIRKGLELTPLLPGTPEQIAEAAQAWCEVLADREREPSHWYLAGYYSRMMGKAAGDKLDDLDPAVVAWLNGWNDANGDLLYG